MNNYTLHKLPEGFIITSDEEIKDDDFGLIEDGGVYKLAKHPLKIKQNLKVIAQQDQIDFSTLSKEEHKEIGWFDVEKLAKDEHMFNHKSIKEIDFRLGVEVGFQKAQELLSDRMFTKNDLILFIKYYNGTVPLSFTSTGENNELSIEEVVNNFILSQPKSWKIAYFKRYYQRRN